MDLDRADRKGLIRESYRIEGIGAAECRSILVDWALSLPEDASQTDALRTLIAAYGSDNPDHPMTALLTEGLTTAAPPRRRGGRAGARRQL